MFLGGLFDNVKEFLSNYEEWHAAVIGFAEGFLPWIPEHGMSDSIKEQVEEEYHYYASAIVVGLIARMVTITLVVIWGLSRIVPLFV